MSRFWSLSFLFAAVAVLAVGNASANVTLLTEDFAYPDGDLVGAPGSPWTNHSGSGSFIQVASEQAVVTHGSGSREDAGTNFTTKRGGVLTATFDVVVTDDAVIGGGDYEYFAHFMEDGNFNFRSRLSVANPSGTGDFSFGISTSTSSEQALSSDFSFGDTIPVVLEFDFDTGLGSATVGGETILGTNPVFGDDLNRFALRQSTSSNNETIVVDNLVVSHVPEPSTAIMALGACLAGMVGLRRYWG